MDWAELMEKETYPDLWLPLLNMLKERGDTFTYKEISELWGRGKSNVYNKVEGWRGFAPRLIDVDESTAPYEIHFTWDNLPYAEPPEVEVEKEEKNFPGFLTQRTVKSITDALKKHDVLDEEHELEFEKGHVWHTETQRGQLITYVTRDGVRLVRAIALYDNGFIVSTVNINTVKESWQ